MCVQHTTELCPISTPSVSKKSLPLQYRYANGVRKCQKSAYPCGRIVHIHRSANMTTFFAFDLAEWVTCFTVRADPVIRSSHLNSTIFRLNPHGYRWSAGSNSIVFDECQNNSANYIQGTNDRTSSTENSCLNVYGRACSEKPRCVAVKMIERSEIEDNRQNSKDARHYIKELFLANPSLKRF